jgi:hypothetical protein
MKRHRQRVGGVAQALHRLSIDIALARERANDDAARAGDLAAWMDRSIEDASAAS